MSTHLPQTRWPMTESTAAVTAFLATLLAPPQLLGLGEPTHGVAAFPLWRNRIFQGLVEHHGFRSIAIESDVIAGLRANAYVTGGPGELDEVMNDGFSHGFGRVQANRELLVWMRAFNAERAQADQVGFYGFDPPIENMWAASPRPSLLALHAFLARHFTHLPVDAATLEHLCGEDAPWTHQAAAMDPSQSVGATAQAQHLHVLADDLLAFLDTQTPGLLSSPDLWEAQVHARTALGLLRYHANMAAASPERISQMLALRAVMMTSNLTAIAERENPRGPTLVFAHNSHLQRNASQIRMDSMKADWWPTGAHLALRLGTRYAFVAMSSGQDAGLPVKLVQDWARQQNDGPYLYATPELQQMDGVMVITDAAGAA
ncbi:erythromycin esterase family protein [Deinococcus arenicola]|uniref:Erythromycin esterase family protein n=1 Tax=Deinococcus arenicola TaxID=2994950 RepID=A0ABU4DPJ4_9DEIO|nr:erythromycin esterase family protein [Deinococcus sp. ZS9-10]MDV6374343.1 erythromycin esterase family protein [Deinococcus sp. ZS9-10]